MTHIIRKPRNPFNNTLTSEFITPFSDVFDSFFKNEFPEFYKKSGISFMKGSYPKVNIFDYEDKLVIEAEIPGLTKEDINIKIKDSILTLSGEKRVDKKHENSNCIHHELKHSSFHRSFDISENIDDTKISAEFKNGILDIILPKLRPNKVEENEKSIDIK